MARIGTSQPERLGRCVSSDGRTTLDIRQDKTSKRFRREIRLSKVVTAADPISAVNSEVSASVIFIVDEPKYGFSDADLTAMVSGFLTYLGFAGNQTKLLQGEN
jgi:hypothetical protein